MIKDRLEIREETAQAHTVQMCVDGKVVGTLYLDPPMRFEGDVEQSARAFMEEVMKRWHTNTSESK